LGVLQCNCQRKLDPRVIFSSQLQQLNIFFIQVLSGAHSRFLPRGNDLKGQSRGDARVKMDCQGQRTRIEIRVAEPDVPRATALPHGSLGVALNCPRPPLGAVECYKLDFASSRLPNNEQAERSSTHSEANNHAIGLLCPRSSRQVPTMS